MNDFIVMPEGVNVFNGSHERCDMAQGPCSCGAWHTLKDRPDSVWSGSSRAAGVDFEPSSAEEKYNRVLTEGGTE